MATNIFVNMREYLCWLQSLEEHLYQLQVNEDDPAKIRPLFAAIDNYRHRHVAIAIRVDRIIYKFKLDNPRNCWSPWKLIKEFTPHKIGRCRWRLEDWQLL